MRKFGIFNVFENEFMKIGLYFFQFKKNIVSKVKGIQTVTNTVVLIRINL